MVSLIFIEKLQAPSILKFTSSSFSELHKLNIPRMDPYKLPQSAPIHAFNPKMPINFLLHHTNVSIHGMDKVQIIQIKYVRWIFGFKAT